MTEEAGRQGQTAQLSTAAASRQHYQSINLGAEQNIGSCSARLQSNDDDITEEKKAQCNDLMTKERSRWIKQTG